jgi:peroxiredoxin
MKKTIIFFLLAAVCLSGSQVKGQVPTSALDVSPLLIGESVPDGSLTDTKGNTVSFYSLISEKPAVVIFYRGDWCSNCINHFSAEITPNLQAISDLGYKLIAISPDAPDKLLSTSEKTKIDPSMLFGDCDVSLAKAFGIAWKQGDRMKDMIIQASGGKNTEPLLPVPAVYVIGADKKILFEYINPNGPQSALRMKWKLLQPILQALK